MRTSRHWEKDREEREAIIQAIGIGNIVKIVTIDRGHEKGPEVHKITDTGIILIYNAWTGKMITKLIARPGQIKRYYQDGLTPIELISIAKKHERQGLNI